MRTSLRGHALPEDHIELEQLKQQGRLLYAKCCDCDATFSAANLHTPLGYVESQISGMCEDCFDHLLAQEPEA